MFGKARVGSDVNAEQISRRQYVETANGDYVWFWYTREGYIVKWVLFLSIMTIFTVWIIGGRTHAKRRMRKGLKPMKYHGWLLSRQERARVDPAYAWPQATYAAYPVGPGGPPPPGGYYTMHPMPPPVYDPNRPPVYEGGPPPPMPMGGSKVDPSQQQQQQGVDGPRPGDDYAPPPGPPPPMR